MIIQLQGISFVMLYDCGKVADNKNRGILCDE